MKLFLITDRMQARYRDEVPQTPTTTPERIPLNVPILSSTLSPDPKDTDDNQAVDWDASSITSSRDTCPLVFTPEQQLHNSLQRFSYGKSADADRDSEDGERFCDPALNMNKVYLQFEERLMSLRKDNECLRQQLSNMQAENTTLQQQLKSQQCASRLLTGYNWEAAIATLEQEVEEWKSKANDRIALGTFIKTCGKRLTSYDCQDIQRHMQNLRCELEDLMQIYSDLQIHWHPLPPDENGDLEILSARILGQTSTRSGVFTGSHILRALTSAAICEWVLECELREDCLSNNLLMETMLGHLVTQGGCPLNSA